MAADVSFSNDLSSEISNRVTGDNLLNTRVDNLTSAFQASNIDLQTQIYATVSSLQAEAATRATMDTELLSKIDMLFLYFFHHDSQGAYIDANNQIQFMYPTP
jgi:hypothetical protein